MLKIKNLLDGYKKFYKKYFVDSPNVYKNLVDNGQKPKILVIACSDSRVDPSTVFNTKPGDIFVIRNVANLVPPFEDDKFHCHGTSAAIEYAVKYLSVKNIIVFGHSHCGGIETLISDRNGNDFFIDEWLNIAKEAKIKALKKFKDSDNSYEIAEVCSKESILVSIKNLKTFPFILDKLKIKDIEINGVYLHLDNGKLDNIED